MVTLSTLPSEIKQYELFYRLKPREAIALCSTSNVFKEFCKKRDVRVKTFVNYYSLLSNDALAVIMKELITSKLTIRQAEKLEAILRVNNTLANNLYEEQRVKRVTVYPALSLCETTISAYILLKYGANPNDIVNQKTLNKPIPVLTWHTDRSNFNIANLLLAFGVNINGKDSRTKMISEYSNIFAYSDLALLLRRYHTIFTTVQLPSVLTSTYYIYFPFVIMGNRVDYNNAHNIHTYKEYYGVDSTCMSILLPICYGLDVDNTFITHLISIIEVANKEGIRVQTSDDIYIILNIVNNMLNAESIVSNNRSNYEYLITREYVILAYLNTHSLMMYWNDNNFWIDKYHRDYGILDTMVTRDIYLERYVSIVLTINDIEVVLDYNKGLGFILTMFFFDRATNITSIKAMNIRFSTKYHSTMEIIQQLWRIEFNNGLQHNDILGFNEDMNDIMPVKAYTVILVSDSNKMKVQFDSLQFFAGYILYCEISGRDYHNHYTQLTRVTLD